MQQTRVFDDLQGVVNFDAVVKSLVDLDLLIVVAVAPWRELHVVAMAAPIDNPMVARWRYKAGVRTGQIRH